MSASTDSIIDHPKSRLSIFPHRGVDYSWLKHWWLLLLDRDTFIAPFIFSFYFIFKPPLLPFSPTVKITGGRVFLGSPSVWLAMSLFWPIHWTYSLTAITFRMYLLPCNTQFQLKSISTEYCTQWPWPFDPQTTCISKHFTNAVILLYNMSM